MSKPKYDYYGYVLRRIKKYPKIKNENSIVSKLQCIAIEKELEKLETDTNKEKLKVVKMVLIDNTHTIQGAAMETFVSEFTARRWVQKFVNDVGKSAGF